MAGRSPRSVAIQAGVAVGLLTLLAVEVALWANGIQGPRWLPPITALVVGGLCYVLVFRQLGMYIQDRVRIIYKTIRRLKWIEQPDQPRHGQRHCRAGQP